MKRIAIFLMGLCMATALVAQPPQGEIEIPEAVKVSFEKKHGSAEMVTWNMEGTNYVADLMEGEVGVRSVFRENGDWIRSSWSTDIGGIPEPAQRAFREAYPHIQLDYVEVVHERGQKRRFAAETRTDNGYVLMEVDETGKVLRHDRPEEEE